MLRLAVFVIATVVTAPIRVGVHIPNSVTITLPSVVTLPTPAPLPTASAPGSTSPTGATPSPAPGATPAPSATQAMADEIASQITNQLSESMGASQTKPQVSVQYVPPQLTSATATPSPNAGGDYVATINF